MQHGEGAGGRHVHRLDLCWRSFGAAWKRDQEGLRMQDTCCKVGWRVFGQFSQEFVMEESYESSSG